MERECGCIDGRFLCVEAERLWRAYVATPVADNVESSYWRGKYRDHTGQTDRAGMIFESASNAAREA